MSAGLFDRFVASVVELFDLEGREVVDGAVGAFGVEPQHPGGSGGLDLVDVAPGPFVVDQLGLVQADELESATPVLLAFHCSPKRAGKSSTTCDASAVGGSVASSCPV